MKDHFITLAVMLLLLLGSLAVIGETEAAEGDPDGYGYKYVDSEEPEPKLEYDYIEIKSDDDAVGWDTSNYQALVQADMGFTFNYYGSTYSKIYISTYGAMSFVQNQASSYRNYGSKNIPSSASPVGIMPVYWTYYNCYTPSSDRLFSLQTQIDGEKVFIVEWNPSTGGKFQAILFESGMIKYQIQSVPRSPVGSYASMGIEKPDGSTGIGYLDYGWQTSDVFSLPFAIAFVLDEIEIKSVKLIDGDGRNGETVYAGSRAYTFSLEAKHSSGGNRITNVILVLGSLYDQERINLMYSHKNKTFTQLTGMKIATLEFDECKWDQMGNYLTVDFAVDFSMEYPSQSMRNVSARVSGKSAVPDKKDLGEIYWVETEVEWRPGELHVERTSDGRYLTDGDNIAGKETIRFAGLKIYYENSDVQPRATLFNLEIEDNYGTKKIAYIQQGSMLDVTWTSIDQTTLMTWKITAVGFPRFSMLSEQPLEFSLAIDTDSPDGIPEIRIYPDSLNDEPSDHDNDGKIFVQWDEAQDGGSGIGKYIVRVQSGDYTEEKSLGKYSRNTSMGRENFNGIPEGIANISVTPVDDVGNIGPSTWTLFTVDLTGPSYHILDPLPGEWALKYRPTLSFRIIDELTGVYGESLEYRVSKDGGYTFEDWESFYYFGKSNDVIRTIEPVLNEGKNNLIELRSTDVAGSEITTSELFNIWVDFRSPEIIMSQPEVDENGTTVNWLMNTDETLNIRMHDWNGAGIDPSTISYRISTDGGETFSANVPLEGESYNNSRGFEEYAFSIKSDEWVQGMDNILVMEVHDRVGRNTSQTFRIKFDMEPEFQIISPIYRTDLYDNETIPFIIDVNDPDGNDDVVVTWMSNVDGLLGTGTSFEVELTPGDHIIMVTIEDGVHTIKEIFSISVRDSMLDDPRFKDSDGDGMNDRYEREHGLNPLADDADNDLDGDGYSNIEEYYANTDPSDKDDYPGSEIVEERFPVMPVIALVVSLMILMAAGVMVVREANRSNVAPTPPPSYLTGYQNSQQAALPQSNLPSLPPKSG